MGSLLAFTSALSYSAMYFLVRSGVRKNDLDGGAFVTTLCNVILLVTAVGTVSLLGSPPSWEATGLSWFVAAGLLGTFIGRILLFAGPRRIGPVRTASITNTAPIITIGIAVVALGEELSSTAIVAVVLVLIGLTVLTLEAFQTSDQTIGRTSDEAAEAAVQATDEKPVVHRPGRRETTRRVIVRFGTPAIVGLGLAALSAVSFGTARVTRRIGLDTMPDPLVGAMVGASTALVSNLLFQAWQGRLGSVVLDSLRDVRVRLWLAGVCSTIGLLTFFLALRLEPLSHVAVIAASETIITLVVGSLLFRKSERLSIRAAIPALCVFAGGILVALD